MKISLLDDLKNDKTQTNLWIALLFSITPFLFGSANIYFTNVTEFTFLFSKIFYYILALTLLVSIGIFIFLQKINNIYTKKIAVLFFAFGLLFWIQGNIIVWNYGVLNGQTIPWEDYFWNGVIDAIVWIGILAISFLKSDVIYRHIKTVCIFLILIQFVGLMATVYAAPAEPDWKYQDLSQNSQLYKFSSDSNVIIIILDTFQSDLFQEIINDDGKYREMFDGFTYYRNSAGGFPMTYPSVNLMLTGKYYDDSVPITDFIKNTTMDNSLPLVLKQNGFRTSIKTDHIATIYPTPEVYDDISNTRSLSQDTNLDDTRFLMELTSFRHIPQPLKVIFFSKPLISDSGKIPSDLIMYETFQKDITTGSPSPTFKIFHLNGVHQPFVINENLESEELPFNRSGAKSTAKAALSITHALLSSLKEQEAYDNSLIFIVGDHGAQDEHMGLNNTVDKNLVDFPTVPENIVSSGIPLILVKPINSTGPLSISDAPVSLQDIPKTVAESYKIANNYSGESVFDNSNNRERIRFYYHFGWDRWNNGYLPKMSEYEINGFSWDPVSWKSTYRVFTPKNVQFNPPVYYPGSLIQFGTDGNDDTYLGYGWGGPENGYRWTTANSSSMIFTMNNSPQSDLELNLQFYPFLVDNKLNHQRLNIRFNGHLIKNYSISTPGLQNLTVEIDHSFIAQNNQVLTFELPDSTSPYELGQSADMRKLGIAVKTIRFAEKNESGSLPAERNFSL